MGKEIFTGRVLLTRFFKEFFLKALEESKDSRSFLPFRKQRDQEEIVNPRIFLFHGHDGLGKTSALNACIRVAEDAAEEAKKELNVIHIDWKQWYSEKCSIPGTPREFNNSLCTILTGKSLGIESCLANCKSISEKVQKLDDLLKNIAGDEWPKEIFADSDPNTTYNEWIQSKLTKQDIEFLGKSEDLRAEAIANGLAEASLENALILAIDSYEYLPPEIDQWLHRAFFGKIYNQKNRIITIVSGCNGFTRGFRNELPEELLFQFDFSTNPMTLSDIASIASKEGIALTEEEIYRIEQCTAGFPLFVRDLALYRKNGIGPEIIPETYSAELPSPMEVAEGVTSRFLGFCTDQTIRERVFSLAMLRHYDESFLGQLWGVSPTDVQKNIKELAEQFSFISGNSVDPLVRSCLINFLMGEFAKKGKSLLSGFFENYSNICTSYFQEQLTAIQDQEPASGKRYENHRYRAGLANYIDGLMWGSPKSVIELIPGIYLELQYFCPSLAIQILWQLKEFEPVIPGKSVPTLELLQRGGLLADRSLVLDSLPVQEVEREIVDFLSGCSQLSDLQKSLLHQKLGEMELRMGNFSASMEQFGKALSAGPVYEDGYLYDDFVMLGYGFLKEGKLDLAVSAFSNAVLIRGDRFVPLHESGIAQVKLKQYDSAATSLTRASEINPENQETWFNLGLACAALDRYEEAIDAFTNATKKGPQRAEIWFEAAKAYTSVKRYNEAIKAYEEVVKLDAENYEAWFRMGQCCSMQGLSDKAVEAFRKAIEIKYDYTEAVMAMGQELYDRGFFAESAEAFEHAVSLDKNDFVAWNSLALSYYHAENYEKAIESAQAAAALKNDESEPLMTIGHAQTALGNFAGADEAYARASEINPDNPEIWNHIGNSFYAQSLYTEAISAFEKSIKLNPVQESTWLSIGLAYQVQENFPKAVESFAKAVEIEPGNSESWFQKGRVHMSLEQYKDAAECFGKSVEINPDSHDAWYRRGLACAKINDHKRAIDSFVKASTLWSSDPDIWYHLGLSYSITGRHEEAVKAFREASNLAPSRHEIWHNLGLSLKSLENYQEAIDAFTAALNIAPEKAETLVNMGQCQYYLGKYDEAKETFTQAVKFEPENLDTLFHLGLACHAQGQYTEAISHYKEITEKKPDSGDAWYNMALAFHALADYPKAIEIYNITVKKWPQNGPAWYNLGLAYHTVKKLDKAVKAYREAGRLNPDQAEIWYHLGLSFHALEQFGEAIQAYRRTVHLVPDNFDAWLNLGLAYQAWGQHLDAMDCFSRASELKPDNPDALGYLAVSCYETGDYKKSLDSAIKALELKPDETWIMGYALLSSALSRHTDKAIEYMEKISSLDPSGNELSRVLYNLNNFLKKNPSREDLEVIKSRLQESLQDNEAMQIS
ncbi:MAG: tetratricopeptide repeat protein [Fibrobacter sp.]|nr:tetratricopeptide repeat protein [Fibrobacter sp.]